MKLYGAQLRIPYENIRFTTTKLPGRCYVTLHQSTHRKRYLIFTLHGPWVLLWQLYRKFHMDGCGMVATAVYSVGTGEERVCIQSSYSQTRITEFVLLLCTKTAKKACSVYLWKSFVHKGLDFLSGKISFYAKWLLVSHSFIYFDSFNLDYLTLALFCFVY